jgi:diguanylate cyclase (GGDEF)-like protein/PAS domain S-box-containing protein
MSIVPKEPNNPITPDDPGFYKDLLDHMSDGVYFVDRDRRILYWNEGARRLTGYEADELLGKRCQDDVLCHVDAAGKKLCQSDCPLAASIADGGSHEASVFLRHKQGRRVPVQVRVQPIRGLDGSIVGAIEIFSDDSARSDARRRIDAMKRLAFLDHLTQLPNRRFLEMSLHTALGEFKVHSDPFGVMMMDLDGLKAINDSYGHNCGDTVLREVALTLAGALRPADIVGRWGGDEFLAIVQNVNQETMEQLTTRSVLMVAEAAVRSPDGTPILLSISAGAVLAQPGDSAEELIRRADMIMYQSKANRRNSASAE